VEGITEPVVILCCAILLMKKIMLLGEEKGWCKWFAIFIVFHGCNNVSLTSIFCRTDCIVSMPSCVALTQSFLGRLLMMQQKSFSFSPFEDKHRQFVRLKRYDFLRVYGIPLHGIFIFSISCYWPMTKGTFLRILFQQSMQFATTKFELIHS